MSIDHDYLPGDRTHPMGSDPRCGECGGTKRDHRDGEPDAHDRASMGQVSRAQAEVARQILIAFYFMDDPAINPDEVELLTPEEFGSRGWGLVWREGPDDWAYEFAQRDVSGVHVEAVDGTSVALLEERV